MQIRSITPVLVVKSIEEALPFWTGRLGFSVSDGVSDGPGPSFLLLERDGQQILLQEAGSLVRRLDPEQADHARPGHAFLHLGVDSLEEAEEVLTGQPLLTPPADTLYGTREFIALDPEGSGLIFSQDVATDEA